MRTKRLLLLSTLLVMIGNVWAQGPNNSGTYYQAANGKKGSALKTALGNIISTGAYNIGYDGLIEAYKQTDKRADGKLRDWYSNATNYTWDDRNGNSAEGVGWNREHSVPQSWFNKANPMKADIVHVVPTDCYVNNRRGSYPFGEVNTVTYSSKNGYSKLGSCKTTGYTNTVFEPNDEIKGDIARIYFYMVTRYQSQCSSWGNDVFSSANLGFEKWVLDMLLRWAKQDPVDEVETARNNAVYATQKNRNPFVDYPGLEDYIWGDKTDTQFSYDNYAGGGSGTSTTVAMPVISPDAGTYYNNVEVTITCSTTGADIYYTTDGADANEQSIPYTGSFTIYETSTIKAVAIKDGESSAQAIASYIIRDTGSETPESGTLQLNNAFFGTSYSGALTGSDFGDKDGTENGITVVYSKGTGNNQYINDSQIRFYPGNTLTVSVGQGKLTAIDVVLAESSTNGLTVDVGNMDNTNGTTKKWTGEAQRVTFGYNATKHVKIASLKVTVDNPTGIDQPHTTPLDGKRVIYNLRGQRVTNPTRGVYIVDGKKVVIR